MQVFTRQNKTIPPLPHEIQVLSSAGDGSKPPAFEKLSPVVSKTRLLTSLSGFCENAKVACGCHLQYESGEWRTKDPQGEVSEGGGVDEEVVGQLGPLLRGLLVVQYPVLPQGYHQLVLHTKSAFVRSKQIIQ